MKPVDQTVFDSKTGNCFAAVLASLFELPLESLPFPDGIEENFWPTYQNWLKSHNLVLRTFLAGPDCRDWIPKECYLSATVLSPRFEGVFHAVIIYNGKIVHDPHPSKASLADNLDAVVNVDIIFPLDPSKPSLVGLK
jgi:hypothetical protein